MLYNLGIFLINTACEFRLFVNYQANLIILLSMNKALLSFLSLTLVLFVSSNAGAEPNLRDLKGLKAESLVEIMGLSLIHI